jgi:signal transduction histidine kinase
LQVSENFCQVLRNSLPESVEGRPLPDLLWEFVGAEEVLGRVLWGELPCFRLDWINRTALDGSTCYVDFWVVPLADDDPERGLLLIIEDVSQAGQLEQRLAQDRNQLRLTQARLVQANEELERLSRLKTLFLSVAVHDLRAPLSAIGLSLELALKYLGSNRVTEAPHYLSTARDQVSQLDNLIGNLLDLDLLEQGRLSVYPVPCDLNSILNESVEMMGEYIQHRGLKLRVAIPLAPIWVRVDPVRARQILTNLLSNAVKYSSAVGTVQVST